jgi:hypothetical protein
MRPLHLGCLAAEMRRLRESTVLGWLLLRPWHVSESVAELLLSSWCAIRDFLWSLAWTPNVRRFTSGTVEQGSCTNSGPLALSRLSTKMPSAGSGRSGHPRQHGIQTSRCFWWRARAEWCGGLLPGSPNWKVFRPLPPTAVWRSARTAIRCEHRHRRAMRATHRSPLTPSTSLREPSVPAHVGTPGLRRIRLAGWWPRSAAIKARRSDSSHGSIKTARPLRCECFAER